jgi:hypothetical protein
MIGIDRRTADRGLETFTCPSSRPWLVIAGFLTFLVNLHRPLRPVRVEVRRRHEVR